MAELFRSQKGMFPAQNVTSLVNQEASRQAILPALEVAFQQVQPDDSVFVYLAGHGAVVKDEYFFVAHDSDPDQIATTCVPLKKIKEAFDASPSQRAFLWLDVCHSGGILAGTWCPPLMIAMSSIGP